VGGVVAQPSLKLRANARPRALHGHPWVFVNEVETLLPPEHDGEVVECRDRTNRLIGTGIYNSKSQIAWRRLSRERVALDAAYLEAAIERALVRRAPENARRLIWSESDDLPGVVADQFDDTLVLQIQTLAMEKRSSLLGDLLASVKARRNHFSQRWPNPAARRSSSRCTRDPAGRGNRGGCGSRARILA
jgi:23S rRNA (cytosine1962-C5)-methyltransferase